MMLACVREVMELSFAALGLNMHFALQKGGCVL
jgi:hypothetical protein